MTTFTHSLALVALATSCLFACSGQSGAQIGASRDTTTSDQSNTEPGAQTAVSGGADGGPGATGGGGAVGGGAADAGAQGDAGAVATAPDIDSLPWQTDASVGFGVATKDTQNPAGSGVLIAYAAYGVTLAGAEAWATALYRASLQARGIRYVYAVQGPSDPQYSQTEIGNSTLGAALLAQVTGTKAAVVVVAHSAGTLVAHELFAELAGGLDAKSVAAQRIAYFNLDGMGDGLTAPLVSYLRRAYFVGAHSAATGTSSTNAATMQQLGATYASAGGYVEVDGSGAGCQTGGLGCMHMTPITTKPHDPANASLTKDYSDFAGRPVSRSFIDAKAAEAGL